jgi:putative ABC transport system permease protein
VSALGRKLVRDLARMRAQALAIAGLVAVAVAALVGSVATARAMRRTQADYYATHRFPHVFAAVSRAPDAVAARLAELPGVAEVEARVAALGRVELPPGGDGLPASARVLSFPPGGPRLSRLHVRSGRAAAPDAAREVLVSEGFAEANRLVPGDPLVLVVNGRREAFRVAGIALSPEVVYAIRPGELFPDDRHFGVVWAPRAALAAATDLEGAFSEVALRLSPGAREAEVIDAVDRILAPHGGAGAHGRDDHVSHRFLTDEIAQLEATATVVPAIFLGVAAFLVSVVLSRLVAAQRPAIGLLKALGYGRGALALHYAGFAAAFALLGAALGSGGGLAFGAWLARTYAGFYRLPALRYEGNGWIVLAAAAAALAAALAGAAGAVLRAARLPPAEAMRPAAPPVYRRTALEVLAPLLAAPARMVARDLARRPARALLSAAGIGAAVGVLVVAGFFDDAIGLIRDQAFVLSQRQDLTVTFTEARGGAAAVELRALPGVLRVEPFRAAPVRLRSGHRARRAALVALEPGAGLVRTAGADGEVVEIPAEGVVLSGRLAAMLGVAPGDPVLVEPLGAGRARPARTLRVAATVDDLLGVSATVSPAEAARLLGEGPLASGAHLAIDPDRRGEVLAALAGRPGVAGVTLRAAALEAFDGTIRRSMGAFFAAIGAFAALLAAGVIYDVARVTWAERERELATLRVLGFTRREVWEIVAGEVLALAAAGVPLGAAMGRAFVAATAARASTELFRIPSAISPATYAVAGLGVAAAALAVALVAVRWVRRLDLAGALRARE